MEARKTVVNFLYGLLMMGVCFLLQSLIAVMALRYYARRQTMVNHPSFWLTMHVINVVMIILVIGNMIQVAIWALLFRLLGEFSAFGDAFYHSAVNFATLGYGDVIMSAQHKMLGPMEAISGMLMIGVSTAALIALFQDAMKKTLKARRTMNQTTA